MNGKDLTKDWHLDKRVNVGHIITTGAALIAAIVFFIRLESRVDLNQQAIAYNAQRIEAQEKRFEKDLGEIKSMLREIRDALGRKADRG